MSTPRGWIILRDGTTLPVPSPLLGQEAITWPPTLAEKAPAGPTAMLRDEDWFRRHEVVPGEAYVFVATNRRIEDVPQAVIDSLLATP